MKYLLDASAIYKMAEANKLDIISDSMTIDLARYELGNAVLKDCTIHKRIDAAKAEQLVNFLYEILDTMDKASVTDGDGIMETALDLKLSFYDAAYVRYSKTTNLTFVTEDDKLSKKLKEHVRVTNLEGLK
jgi:predicted nucleic acid-binding protein